MREFSCEGRLLDRSRALLVVTGEIDMETGERVYQAIDDLQGQGARQVIMDLSGVTFVDSTGLGVLVAEHRREIEAAKGQGLHVVVTAPEVLRVLHLTMLDQVFTVHETREDALESLDGPEPGG